MNLSAIGSGIIKGLVKISQLFLWFLMPVLLGYYWWVIWLPSPLTYYTDTTALGSSKFSQKLQHTGWYSMPPKVVKKQPPVKDLPQEQMPENTNLKISGIFLRQKNPSIVIIANGAKTEVVIEGQSMSNGIKVIKVRPFEIVVEENQRRSIVKMEQVLSFESIYQQSKRLSDVFITNDRLTLRPIDSKSSTHQNKMGTIDSSQQMSSALSQLESEIRNMDSSSHNNNSSSPPKKRQQLSAKAQQLLNDQPRFYQLNDTQQRQIKSMLMAPQFLEAIKADPLVLEQLIDALPANVQP